MQTLDIVESECAVDHVKCLWRQFELLHVSPAVDNGGVGSASPSPRQHSLGDIDADNITGTLLARPAAEPAEAAAEVEDLAPTQNGQQGTQCRPLGHTVQPFDRAAQPAVAGEEFLVVIDVLRHRWSFSGERRSRAILTNVARIRLPALRVPRRVPATFERPATRRP